MPEHLIQLRKAWDATFVESGAETTRRLDLPTTWPSGSSWPARLSRRFQAPRIEPGREQLSLRLASIVGVEAVRLDNLALIRPESGQSALELPLDLAPGTSHRLVLELSPIPPPRLEAEWGMVALVIA